MKHFPLTFALSMATATSTLSEELNIQQKLDDAERRYQFSLVAEECYTDTFNAYALQSPGGRVFKGFPLELYSSSWSKAMGGYIKSGSPKSAMSFAEIVIQDLVANGAYTAAEALDLLGALADC
ncbi:hypothetical protein ACMAZE_01260 [Pseudopelagicola sp. nBUS_20]|uniref:hypothetical protein n=1 Tax=Pseudopelagicola sp. nBUS_20 TaxID=3395317 RepID=UPI003EBB742A